MQSLGALNYNLQILGQEIKLTTNVMLWKLLVCICTCEQQLILRNPLNRLQQVMLQGQVSTAWTGLYKKKKWQHILYTWINNKTSLTQRTRPLRQRKQVKQASLPQTPVPLRRTLGSSCSALPVEPHSCQTRGCMWSTSSDRALSSGRCPLAAHSHPCTQKNIELDKPPSERMCNLQENRFTDWWQWWHWVAFPVTLDCGKQVGHSFSYKGIKP